GAGSDRRCSGGERPSPPRRPRPRWRRRPRGGHPRAGHRREASGLKIHRPRYANHQGPAAGARIRLSATDVVMPVEEDATVYGDEAKFGGGKVIRDGMGQSATASRAAGSPDLVITNVVILDSSGIRKADVGVRDGRISGIGKAGNPGVMDGVSPEL